MKRLVRNSRGEVSYGPKWQHTESSSDPENNDEDDDLHSPIITNQDQIPKGKKVEVTVKDGDLMYAAASEGDWTAAEVLLERDPNLAFHYITEHGDRALHVATAMKRKGFVKRLVERMSEKELAMLDGHGYTSCCYAAISGDVEMARLIIGNRPNLVTVHDEEKATPLGKAALLGNREMLMFLLEGAKDEDLSREEWFDLLLVVIRSKMFDVGIDIIGKNGSIATMANEEGTAMHLLAQVDTSSKKTKISTILNEILDEFSGNRHERFEHREFAKLAEKVWGEMLTMEKDSLMELMKKPVHIVHEAAKIGQVEIVEMLTRSFPQLIWETDSNGYTMFHLAVMYHRLALFELLLQIRPMLGSRNTTWQDRRGNNILHLAAMPTAGTQLKLRPADEIQRELKFFHAVKKIVPRSCEMMRNGKGLTPEELFTKTHKKLLKESQMWMTNRADALMLIATILLTVVFAAAFTVPGGYSSQTGEPVLAKNNWFKAFVVFEVLSMMFSIFSIMMFQSIMGSSFAQNEFLQNLPTLQVYGFTFLLMSLSGAFVAFMASVMLFNINMDGLVWFGIIAVCVYGALFWMYSEMGIWRWLLD